MEHCIHLYGIHCLASTNELPSQAIELNVGSESDPAGQTVIRACGAVGWPQWQQICTGNPDAQPLSLTLVEDPNGYKTPWIT